MGEIVNLRRVKKALKRAESAEQAAANRLLHGRTKAERSGSVAIRRKGAATLDGARLDRNGEPRE